ncbi:uncharacterized protein A4U43_C08F11570 [Asparagus officinalis]|nr:uncharacterized protein A4U43_C08F11570 [Asparagus officinalis]
MIPSSSGASEGEHTTSLVNEIGKKIRSSTPVRNCGWDNIDAGSREAIITRVLTKSYKVKVSQSKLPYNHISGSRSFVVAMSLMKSRHDGKAPFPEFYKETHYQKKRKVWVNEKAQDTYERLVNKTIEQSQPDVTSPMNEFKISIDVLGRRPGYLKGVWDPPSREFIYQAVKEGGHRSLRQLITDAPLVKDASSIQPLRKSDFLIGDSVEDPDAVFIEAEQWLHKTGSGFIYLPKIPRHRSLTEIRRQAVTWEMSWRLTEEHESVHCGYITHQAFPGSSRSHITGLRPGVLGLDAPPRNEFLATASTLRNRLAALGREMPATHHRIYGWVHSLDKSWWTRMTTYVLSRWGEELHACGLYAAVRATMYGLPVSARHFCALFELYNSDSNTFLTRQGELGLALHEMHRISGLPMGQMLYQEYFPSNHELSPLKDRMPDRYETLWDLTCHYHIALTQSEPLAKRTKTFVSLKQFANYLFKNLESNSGEAICELAPLTPSGVNILMKKIDAHSYTTSSSEGGFPAGTKFKSFLWHATAPIRPMTLLAGFLAIWLKKCVVSYQSCDALPLEVLYPAVQLAYKKELSLLPVMVANIHRGLRQLSGAFTRKEKESPTQIPTLKTELPYTYLMAWFVLHRPDMMSVPSATDHSVPLLQLLENGKWEGRGFSDVRQQLQVHKCWTFSTCFPQFSGRYGDSLTDEERPREYRTHLDIGCFNWLVNIRPVGNPRQQLRAHGGLVDGLRAWLWTVTGCTGVKFSLPSADRQLHLTFLSCKWLLAANKTIPVKPIAELEAEEASQVDSRRIWENARSQRARNKTRRIDEEGKKTFHSADEASGGDPEGYEDFSERGLLFIFFFHLPEILKLTMV